MKDISQNPTAAAGSKTLWAVIGALGVAVVALGATLFYVQSRQPSSTGAASPADTPAASTPVAVPAAETAPVSPEKPAAVAPKQAAVSAKPATTQAKKPAAATEVAKPVTAPPAARQVCLDCATVTAVTPVEREGEGSGAGAVAGGVLGALVGSQIGRGQGKDVATVVGAVGGGIAGHQVEKKMKKVTVYQVQLRMDDGSTRTIEQATPASVGARVRVEGTTLQPLN